MGEGVRYCPSCGGENKGSYRYCMHCGSPLAAQTTQAPAVGAGESPAAPPPPPTPVGAATPPASVPEERQGRRRGLTCAIVVVVLVCLCGAISAIALYQYGDYIVDWLEYYSSILGAL